MQLCRWPHLAIQCSPDDSSTDYDIVVRSKKLLFHKRSPLLIIRILLQTTLRVWPNVTKVQEVKTSDSSENCDVTWEFQCKFPIHTWLIYLTSLLDESSTSTHFDMFYCGEDRQMTSPESIFFPFSIGAVFTSPKSTVNWLSSVMLTWKPPQAFFFPSFYHKGN